MDDLSSRMVDALSELLDAIEQHEAKQRPPHRRLQLPATDVPGVYRMSQLPNPSDEFVTDPIAEALRAGIAKLGFFIGRRRPDDMQAIAYEAAGRGANVGHRLDIVTKRWNGVEKANGEVWVA